MKCNGTSGPHPSLQSQSAEVRKVQFHVQRGCPVNHTSGKVVYDFATWIFLEPSNEPVLRHECGGINYLLTPQGIAIMMANHFAYIGKPIVCEHMGRIIE